MPENIEASCSNCAYERGGECHRYPPTIQHVMVPRDGENDPRVDLEVQWPSVTVYAGSNSWCGEHILPNDLLKLAPDKNPNGS